MHKYTDKLPINEPDYYPPSSHTRVPPGMDSAEYIMSALRVSLGLPRAYTATESFAVVESTIPVALHWCDGCQGPSDQPTINGLCPSCAASWQSGGRA